MNLLRFLPRSQRASGPMADSMGRIDDAIGATITRGRAMDDRVGFGPAYVDVTIIRGPSGEHGAPGSVEHLGRFPNLKTTVGMDAWQNGTGGLTMVQGSPATATSGTSFTATGTPWSASALIGATVVFPITNATTTPVYGRILSNTTSVAQVDGFWTPADASGSTPGSTNAFIILSGTLPAKWIGLTNDGTAPAVGDTALTAEITANGLQRALATFAHSGGATTMTLAKTWTASGAQSAQQAGLFTGGYGASGGGTLVAHTTFTSATLASGDSLQLTWTITWPAAG